MKLKLRVSHFFVVLFFAVLISTALFSFRFFPLSEELARAEYARTRLQSVNLKPSPTPAPSPTIVPSPSKVVKSAKQEEPWGVAEKIDESTWTMKVGEDKAMGKASEIFEALNSYRQRKGSGFLSWNDKLAEFAQKRVETFASMGKLDNHSGFQEYLKNEENLKNLGFWAVGENSSYGFQMEGVHLIEWVFAADPPHENNQLDPSWTHVGIGVSGTGVDIVFGKNKM